MMKTLTALIALFLALSASGQQKFEIRGLSWHLGEDEIRPHIESLGFECVTESAAEKSRLRMKGNVITCDDPEQSSRAVLVHTGQDYMKVYRSFTNTWGMTQQEIARFLVDNKPIYELTSGFDYVEQDHIYTGRAADGQMIKVLSNGQLIIEKGTLGKGGPTM